MEQKEQLTLRFEGENDIDLEVLSTTLTATLNCLKVIADETLEERDYCKFIVKNVEKGSFVVFIEALKRTVSAALPILPAAESMVTIFKGILEVRKFLKGDKPRNTERAENHTTVINADGESKVFSNNVINIYTSEGAIEKEMAKISQSLLKDDKRTGLTVEVSEEGKPVETVKYSKDDLRLTTRTIDTVSLNANRLDEISETWLTCKKLELIADSKWEFIWVDRKISAYIEDKEFLQNVKDGKVSFSSKTRLRVKLRVSYAVKDESGVASKILYTIMKVHQIEQEPQFNQAFLDI